MRRSPSTDAARGAACALLAFALICAGSIGLSAAHAAAPAPVSAALHPVRTDGLVMLAFIDPKMGIPQHRAPFPRGWRYLSPPQDRLVLTGPEGVRVFQLHFGRYYHSDDTTARESARKTGYRLAPPMSLGAFVERQVAPQMAQRGYRAVRQFPLPRVVAFLEHFAAGMPQGISRVRFEALGVEWEGADGTRAYSQLTLTQRINHRNQGPPGVAWEVGGMELIARADAYPGARDAFMHAADRTEVNPQWQIAKNQEHLANIGATTQFRTERTRETHVQHVSRMNAILARSETSAPSARINSEIPDIRHAGHLRRSDMVSAGRARTGDAIAGRSVIANPNTGERYRVETGWQHFWVNADGQYFGTDNPLYDPRTDRRISQQGWEPFELVR